MKVYRIAHDSNHYQFLLPKREKDALFFYDFDGTSRAVNWRPPPMTLFTKGKLQRGDFFQFAQGVVISNSRGVDALNVAFFEPAGELLPLTVGKEMYYVLNVTRCIDCLDEETTTREGDDPIVPGSIVQYRFRSQALPAIGLFKIPETARTEVLLVEGIRDRDDEFSAIAERHALTGLQFELLWSSQE